MKFAPLALALTLSIPSLAQSTTPDPANLRGERPNARTGLELPIDRGAAGLQQMLLKLRTRASLMMIVAHPDDEDGGMLTYEVRGHGVRAAMLTLTRGEGGQNLMTGDFNDALGLIRTQELLAADRYFGTQQMFGTEVDFGFSKTREEALAQWTHERVLYDAVRAVRLFRPLVVTSVFVGGPTDGHGHHQVSGQMAQEVFNAAADPNVFPDQIKQGLEPWAPLKVYARVPFARVSDRGMYDYATDQYLPVRFYNYVTKTWSDAVPTANVQIHEGESSDALGMTYVQFARQGLALQKTQIGAGIRVPPAGAFDVGYTRYGSRVSNSSAPEKDFFDGIDTSLAGIATLAPAAPAFLRSELELLSAQIENADLQRTKLVCVSQCSGPDTDHLARYDTAKPETIAPALADALQRLTALIARVEASSIPANQQADVLHELRIKQAQLQEALALAFGVTIDATTSSAEIIAGTQTAVRAQLTSTSPQELTVRNVWLKNSGDATDDPDLSGRELPVLTQQHAITRLITAKPIFTSIITRPYFSRDSVETPVYTVRDPVLRNAPATPPAITASATLSFRGVDFTVARVVHDGPQPLAFIPPVSLTLPFRAVAVAIPAVTVTVPVRPIAEAATHNVGSLQLEMPPGWLSTPARVPLSDTAPLFRLSLPQGTLRPAIVKASATIGQHTYTEGFMPVGYSGLTRTNMFTPATIRIVPVDVHVAPHLRVAYISGTGDEVSELLDNIGVHPTPLKVADLTTANLSVFDVLIFGVRAYTAHSDLAAADKAVADFARNGGTVIVQYQAHAFRPGDAPFPITLAGDGDRVVEEVAPVALTPTPSGVLESPNKITSADFGGWVEERGHGFPASWDPQYEAPTETHDTGQGPQRGGLLVARVGKGYYVYTAFALYRQLPEAVPGAYRLFANLLSLGRSSR